MIAINDRGSHRSRQRLARELAAGRDRLNQGATAIVHRRSGGARPKSDNLRLTDKRRYGDTELWVFAKEGS